jgi:hypothetical protein
LALVPVFAALLVLLAWTVFTVLEGTEFLLCPLDPVLLLRVEAALRFALITSCTSPY